MSPTLLLSEAYGHHRGRWLGAVEDVRYSRGMGFSQKKKSKLESERHMCSKNSLFSREVSEYEE
jgi:hypothetical protein